MNHEQEKTKSNFQFEDLFNRQPIEEDIQQWIALAYLCTAEQKNLKMH